VPDRSESEIHGANLYVADATPMMRSRWSRFEFS
jgi:hypothetical protein